jgi:hypothetical protein
MVERLFHILVGMMREKIVSNLTPDKLAMLSEFGESKARANLYLCAPPEFARKYRLEARRIGSVWVLMIPRWEGGYFNRIIGLGVGTVATESFLDDAIGVLQNAGCSNFMAQISPLAQPPQLLEWLNARGFTNGGNRAKMIRGNEPAPSIPTDLRVESIGKEFADDFADIALAAFGMPPELRPFVTGTLGKSGWHHYLAFDREQAVSAAGMYVKDGISWLSFGSTLASHRNLGGQGAMFARRITDGLALGCRWFVTETTEDTTESPNPSYRNMLRAGFKLGYLRPNYMYKPPDS